MSDIIRGRMKTKLWLLLILTFSIFSLGKVQALDSEKDQEIISVISSDQFANVLVYYQFEDKPYPLRIIHNPKNEILWGNSLKEPTSLSLILIADVPLPLARHLEDLVLGLRGTSDSCYFSLRYGTPEKGWNFISPVHIAESVNDSINDEVMQKTFNSDHFINQVIYYYLDKKYYQVRLLHNPEGKTFSATRKFTLDNNPSAKNFSISWNKKYGIGISTKAPKELVNHLSDSLKHLSYWDWYFNFSLENGTYVTYQTTFLNTTTTYSLDTWFNYTESFGQN